MADMGLTDTRVAYDPSTGEVLDTAPPKRRKGSMPWRWENQPDGSRVRREMTPVEVAERDRTLAAFEEKRAADRAIFAELTPTDKGDPGDPPAMTERPFPLDVRTSAGTELAVCERPNGSLLRAVSRFYDGQNNGKGTRPLAYVTVHVVFANARTGLKYRTRGVMIERGELRTVGEALLKQADELDRQEAAGELPVWLMPQAEIAITIEAPTAAHRDALLTALKESEFDAAAAGETSILVKCADASEANGLVASKGLRGCKVCRE